MRKLPLVLKNLVESLARKKLLRIVSIDNDGILVEMTKAGEDAIEELKKKYDN